MTALRTLMIIIEHFEVSSAHEQAMFTQAIINMVCLPTYTETEEESLERFMCRWRVLLAQVKASRSCAWSDAELGIHLFRKIENLAVMTFDVEKCWSKKWPLLHPHPQPPPPPRTHPATHPHFQPHPHPPTHPAPHWTHGSWPHWLMVHGPWMWLLS